MLYNTVLRRRGCIPKFNKPYFPFKSTFSLNELCNQLIPGSSGVSFKYSRKFVSGDN